MILCRSKFTQTIIWRILRQLKERYSPDIVIHCYTVVSVNKEALIASSGIILCQFCTVPHLVCLRLQHPRSTNHRLVLFWEAKFAIWLSPTYRRYHGLGSVIPVNRELAQPDGQPVKMPPSSGVTVIRLDCVPVLATYLKPANVAINPNLHS